MISFRLGPADGKLLELRRAPLFLRVVQDSSGQFDALDQLDDQAEDGETIFVYRRVGEAGHGIACTRGKGGGCRQFAIAEYIYYRFQPPDDVLRNNDRWAEWALEQVESR